MIFTPNSTPSETLSSDPSITPYLIEDHAASTSAGTKWYTGPRVKQQHPTTGIPEVATIWVTERTRGKFLRTMFPFTALRLPIQNE